MSNSDIGWAAIMSQQATVKADKYYVHWHSNAFVDRGAAVLSGPWILHQRWPVTTVQQAYGFQLSAEISRHADKSSVARATIFIMHLVQCMTK